jgi:WD40 repeat protein
MLFSDQPMPVSVKVAIVIVLMLAAWWYLAPEKKLESEPAVPLPATKREKKRPKKQQQSKKVQQTQQQQVKHRRASQPDVKSSLLLMSLKGHNGAVTSAAFCDDSTVFGGNDDDDDDKRQVLVTASVDGTCRVWVAHPRDASRRSPLFHELRGGVQGDQSSAVCVSGRGHAGNGRLKVAAVTAYSKELQVWGVSVGAADKVIVTSDFGTSNKLGAAARDEFTQLFYCGARTVVAFTPGNDTRVPIYDAGSGACIDTLDTKGLINNACAVSGDGRWLAVATRVTDVKVWDLSKLGSRERKDVMTLRGHTTAVTSVAFGGGRNDGRPDAAATCSLDGTFRVYNIDVRYEASEDTKLLLAVTPTTDALAAFLNNNDDSGVVASLPSPLRLDVIALSPRRSKKHKRLVVALACAHTLVFYDASAPGGRVLAVVPRAHAGNIKGMAFHRCGRTLVTWGVAHSADRGVKLWSVPDVDVD